MLLRETFSNLLYDVSSVFRFRTQKRIEDMESLIDFLQSHTSFQLQRNFDTYCRMRVGGNWQKLYQDATFHRNYEKAIWNSYPFVLYDVLQMLGLSLYRDFDFPASFGKLILCQSVKEVFSRQTPPKILVSVWEENCSIISARIAEFNLLSSKSINQIPISSYYKIFQEIPFIHDLRICDYDSLLANQRFLLCNTHAKFLRLFVPNVFRDNYKNFDSFDEVIKNSNKI